MSSKELNKPLESASLRGVQPVSDSDDDQSSPECLLSLQPVEDNYCSSDDEARKKEPMLNSTDINGSDVKPWQLKYFLKFGFESFWGKFTMESITAQGLLENAFTMFFPDGFPACYKKLSKISKNDSMEKIILKYYQQFMEKSLNKCLQQFFPNNLDTEGDTEEVKVKVLKHLVEHFDTDEFRGAYLLAGRTADVLNYLIIDESRSDVNAKSHDKNEKHELVRGLVYQIMSYLNIPVKFNGEGRYDFHQKNIPDRTLKEPISFKTKPDATLYVQSGECEYRMPFGVVEVHGPYSLDVLRKVKKCSADDSTLSSPTASPPSATSPASGGDEKTKSAQDLIHKADTPNIFGHGDEKELNILRMIPEEEEKLNKLTDDVSSEMTSLSISNERTDPSDPVTITASAQTDKVFGSTSSSDTSVYKSERKKKKMNDEIRNKGPSACKSDHVFQKVYGQLPTEMYGMLLEKDKCIWEEFGPNGEKTHVGLGIFVMNEYIYLAKITQNLAGGPTITYAKNFWFDLANPEHLFAFMAFILCYYKIELSMYMKRIHEKDRRGLKSSKSEWTDAVSAHFEDENY